MTKSTVDSGGNYLGSFPDDADLGALPTGVSVVPSAPEHASQKWDGAAWSAPPPAPSRADDAEAAIRATPALLALGRLATGDDALSEDALVALARAKLP